VIGHRLFRWADGNAVFGQAEWRGELEVVGVAFIERNNGIEMPVLCAEAIEGEGIVGFVQGCGGDAQAEEVDGFVHGGEVGHRVMPMVVEDIDDQG